jgi:hypothetical protein
MKEIKQPNDICVDMTWREFILKLLISFLLIMPISMIGLSFTGYYIGILLTISSTPIIAAFVIIGATIGAFCGITLTILMIKIGHHK